MRSGGNDSDSETSGLRPMCKPGIMPGFTVKMPLEWADSFPENPEVEPAPAAGVGTLVEPLSADLQEACCAVLVRKIRRKIRGIAASTRHFAVHIRFSQS